ncbi:cupin domain-containing protein [Streptomyces sp. G35A]
MSTPTQISGTFASVSSSHIDPADDLAGVVLQQRSSRVSQSAVESSRGSERPSPVSHPAAQPLQPYPKPPDPPILRTTRADPRMEGRTTVSDLLLERVADPDAVMRATDMRPTQANGWTYQRAGTPNRSLQALRVHIPYATQSDVVRSHPGEEWLYVLEGRLRLHLADAEYPLTAGDSAHFGSLTPHRLAAEDPDGVGLLFVHTLLQSPSAAPCFGPAVEHVL